MSSEGKLYVVARNDQTVKWYIQRYWKCKELAVQRKEPLIITPLPAYLWEEIGTDLLRLKGTTYLLVLDYFSRYSELMKLTSTSLWSLSWAQGIGIWKRSVTPHWVWLMLWNQCLQDTVYLPVWGATMEHNSIIQRCVRLRLHMGLSTNQQSQISTNQWRS